MKASSTKTLLKAALLCSLSGILGIAVTDKAFSAAAAKPRAGEGRQSGSTKVDPSDPANVIYLDTSGKPAGVGDPTKPASTMWKAGQGWHPQALTASNLPKDKYGLIDWAKAVSDGVIKPKHSIDPKEEDSDPMDLDVLIETKSDFVNNVIYPHKMHTFWLKCEICHATVGGPIFMPAAGQNNMTMAGIAQGQWCGRCHGKIAFPLADCNRCHSSPKKPVGKK